MTQAMYRLFRSGFIVAAGLWVAAVVCVPQSHAAPQITSKTVYYTVRGSTPAELLSYMISRGPGGHSGRALGTTRARLTQNSQFNGEARCRLRNHRVTLNMTITLPRLANGQNLTSGTRSRWNNFANHVRNHENRHKAIYTQCAKRIERRVRALNGTMSCRALSARMRQVFNEENRRCDQRHAAYDRAEEARIRRLPLIVHASRPSRRPSASQRAQSRTTRQSTPTTRRTLQAADIR